MRLLSKNGYVRVLTLTKISRSPYRIGTLNQATGLVEKGEEEEGEEALEEAEDSTEIEEIEGIEEIGEIGEIEVVEEREEEIEIKTIITTQIKRRCMWIRTLG
jgi:hypothetical protein